jgi:hypothetical protein
MSVELRITSYEDLTERPLVLTITHAESLDKPLVLHITGFEAERGLQPLSLAVAGFSEVKDKQGKVIERILKLSRNGKKAAKTNGKKSRSQKAQQQSVQEQAQHKEPVYVSRDHYEHLKKTGLINNPKIEFRVKA